MEFTGIVYPEQLWVLTEVLERRCDGANIKPGTPEYEADGDLICACTMMSSYGSGISINAFAAIRPSIQCEPVRILSPAICPSFPGLSFKRYTVVSVLSD